jgi:hypothetical protein
VRDRVLALCLAADSAQDEDQFCVMRGKLLCRIYRWRPLICRLAGPSYSFQSPHDRRFEGNGCPRLRSSSTRGTPPRMNRTPLYRAMSLLELDFVNEFGARARPSTISRTILEAFGSTPELNSTPAP